MTLITGDVATYTVQQGRAAATIQPASGRTAITYRTSTEGGGYYLFPSDVLQHVRAGLLDKRLFDLAYLARNGYADDRRRQLPLIVQYARRATAATLRGQATGLAGHAASAAMTSVNGAAIEVDKRRTAQFWQEIRGTAAASAPAARPQAGTRAPAPVRPAPTGLVPAAPAASGAPRLGNGLRNVWLDAKVTARDEGSNAQIGAPTAWGAGLTGTGVDVGIIDTGIDATHPDLTGKVVAGRSFVAGGDPDDVTDGHGHGTHVAGIVTGSGAASAGRHQGVAHGSRLIIAKALDDSGNAPASQIIEAMEWMAAERHARVVNMSLGADPTDGTDPLSVAANNLTAAHGTLFVVAAGNDGPLPNTVEAPAAADAALAVGAVDSGDHLAFFSGRGPRLGADFAVKPEVTAPGVDIISARAAGTSLGSPVDDRYTRASGTSMATPHVAGAAAILAQQHPDWSPAQLKNALVGAAKDGGFSPYEQGAGRLDVARAVTQKITHDTPSIHAGFPPPWDQPLTRRVTFRNDGAAPVTLDAAATLTLDGPGTPAPDGLVTVTPGSVTVPAGGTAPVDVTIDPSVGPSGTYTGRLLATGGDGERLTVPIGFRKVGPRRDLTVRLDTSSLPSRLVPDFLLNQVLAVRVNDDDPKFAGEPVDVVGSAWRATGEPGVFHLDLSLPEDGIYSVDTVFTWFDRIDGRFDQAYLGDPEVRLDQDRTVTFDLAKLVRVDVRTPRPSEPVTVNFLTTRTLSSGRESGSGGLNSYQLSASGEYWALPTEKPTVGSFLYLFDVIRPEPQVSASLVGGRGLVLHPRYASEWNDVPKIDGDRQLMLAGEADLRAGRDVRDKLVLLDPGTGDPASAERFHSGVRLAIQAGAAAILTDSPTAWGIFLDPDENRLPVIWINRDEADRVRAALAGARGAARVDLHGVPTQRYQYNVVFYLRDRIPGRIDFAPGARGFAEIAATYHGQGPRAQLAFGPAPEVNQVNLTFAPGQTFTQRLTRNFAGRVKRTEYYNVTGPDVLWRREYVFSDMPFGASARGVNSSRGFTRATEGREDWNETVLPTQISPGPDKPAALGNTFTCDSCRQGDRLRLRTQSRGANAEAGDPSHRVLSNGIPTEEIHLFAGDQEIRSSGGVFEVPAEPATYRLTSTYRHGYGLPHTGTTVTTSWTFRSRRPAAATVQPPFRCVNTGDTAPCAFLPLTYLRYDLGLAPDDTAPAGQPFTFTVAGTGNPPTETKRLDGLRVWTSADNGATWTAAQVTGGPGDTYRVRVANPAGTGTAVSIRAQAWDRDGGSIEQTITNAYLLGG